MVKVKKASWREYVNKIFKLPEDLIFHDPVITLLGSQKLCIENFQTILEYRDERILVRVHQQKLLISGKNLEITYYTSDEMRICGEIHSVSYISE